MEKNYIYKLKDVSKVYKVGNSTIFALDKVSLEIEEGKITVILGPSGSGKSTLLNIMSGIDERIEGKCIFDDYLRIDKLKDEELTEYREENTGFVFQTYNLLPSFTVYENIELVASLSKDVKIDIDEIIDKVGLTDYKNEFPYKLSGGQKQRVALARAICKNPKVLFCDEPTGALDEKTGIKVLELLDKINKEFGTTIIIVTHNKSIANMADHVIKMNSGKVVENYDNENKKGIESVGW